MELLKDKFLKDIKKDGVLSGESTGDFKREDILNILNLALKYE